MIDRIDRMQSREIERMHLHRQLPDVNAFRALGRLLERAEQITDGAERLQLGALDIDLKDGDGAVRVAERAHDRVEPLHLLSSGSAGHFPFLDRAVRVGEAHVDIAQHPALLSRAERVLRLGIQERIEREDLAPGGPLLERVLKQDVPVRAKRVGEAAPLQRADAAQPLVPVARRVGVGHALARLTAPRRVERIVPLTPK
mmetsp:Transcript_26890/g.62783  ORF Transcript_26890/g.62783 Transcript_26890/m.62783 type:complete len:200 (+) Transcript_26890:600-1199(+)